MINPRTTHFGPIKETATPCILVGEDKKEEREESK
jgi:hypothetical protein